MPTVGPTPAAELLRDYGQRLTEALLAKGQELAAEPAKRRALWPVAVVVVAGVFAARDVLVAGRTLASPRGRGVDALDDRSRPRHVRETGDLAGSGCPRALATGLAR